MYTLFGCIVYVIFAGGAASAFGTVLNTEKSPLEFIWTSIMDANVATAQDRLIDMVYKGEFLQNWQEYYLIYK